MGSLGKSIKLLRIFDPLVYPSFKFMSIFKGLYHTSIGRWILIFGQDLCFLAKIQFYMILTPCVYKLRTSCGQLEPKLLQIEQLYVSTVRPRGTRSMCPQKNRVP